MKSTWRPIKSDGIEVTFAPSCFPEATARKLAEGLEKRKVPGSFHYETVEQAARWLEVHEKYSPARRDPECLRIYERAAKHVVSCFPKKFEIVALGCGGGQKEVRLLRKAESCAMFVAVDVSAPLVLTTMRLASRHTANVRGVVCDIEAGEKLSADCSGPRLITLFGVLPNIEPASLKKILSPWLRPGDHLLISANMVPSIAAMRKIVGGYDNPETREWLWVFLKNLGVKGEPDDIRFQIKLALEMNSAKIEATFKMKSSHLLRLPGKNIALKKGETLRLFYSWRYTEEGINHLLATIGVLKRSWIISNAEEGVFLVRALNA